jgi:DNA-binding IclR family transcriptional regulator
MQMKSVRNAVRALALFGADRPELGVSDVGRQLGIPRSSASRLLNALGDGGLIEQDPATRRYRPGQLAARLGALYRGSGFLESVHTGAAGLAEETGHSTWVGVLDGQDVIILYAVHGSHPVRYVVEPGARLPAHATATGKALLACLTSEALCELYPDEELPEHTQASLPTRRELLADLESTRQRGYAIGDQENFAGIKSYATALQHSANKSISIGLSFPIANVAPSEQAPLIEALRAATEKIRQIHP